MKSINKKHLNIFIRTNQESFLREAARSHYNDVLDFDSSSAILKIEWREEGLGFTAHVQPFLSPVAISFPEAAFLLVSTKDARPLG